MDHDRQSRIPEILARYEAELLQEWLAEQQAAGTDRPDLIRATELREQAREFIGLMRRATESGSIADIGAPAWAPLREMLAAMSRSRGLQGFSPKDVAVFVFSFKKPLFAQLRREISSVDELFAEIWTATTLVDQLGYWTTETYQRAREEVIARQQQEMLELSTPVVKLWDGVLARPLIGTLDSSRTQVVK